MTKQNYVAYSTNQVKYIYDVLINRNMTFLDNYGLRYYNTQLPSIASMNLNMEYTMHRDLRFFMQLSNITINTVPEYFNEFSPDRPGLYVWAEVQFQKNSQYQSINKFIVPIINLVN